MSENVNAVFKKAQSGLFILRSFRGKNQKETTRQCEDPPLFGVFSSLKKCVE